MARTFHDVRQFLTKLPEIQVMEILEITSEDLVDRFEDFIELKLDGLIEDLEEADEEDAEDQGWEF